MAETLGSLCDKLTVVKLKQWHSTDEPKLASLSRQEARLVEEIDGFLRSAASGAIPLSRITFECNKVYDEEKNKVVLVKGTLGQILSELAEANIALWHEQEKVYEFEKVPESEKNSVVKKLALLNLERSQCIDAVDLALRSQLEGAPERSSQ